MNDIKSIIEDCHKSDLVSKKVIRKIIEIIGQERWQEIYDEETDNLVAFGWYEDALHEVGKYYKVVEYQEERLCLMMHLTLCG